MLTLSLLRPTPRPIYRLLVVRCRCCQQMEPLEILDVNFYCPNCAKLPKKETGNRLKKPLLDD